MAGHTIIVGGGPAGLAVAAALTRAGLPHDVVERSGSVGASWRNHYDRLHLHTPREGSVLPGLSFPADVPRYPSRAEVVAYLEAYAVRFGIRPQFGCEVRTARCENGAWVVDTSAGTRRVANLVIATGYNRVPHVPAWPGQAGFGGRILHSSSYRNGAPFAGQRVLVVGFGNSGGEIAIDLVEHGAAVEMSVRGPVNVVPRDILGIPAQRFSIAERRLPPRLVDAVNGAILRLLGRDLSAYGLQPATTGPATQITERGRIPLIDIGTIDLIARGIIVVRPGLERLTSNGVVFVNGLERAFDAIVLATGYRPRVDAFIGAGVPVLDEHGTPTTSGTRTAAPGLYFCGFRVTATGALREIGLESVRIVRDIARSS